MSDFGRLLMIVGVICIFVGGIFLLLAKIPGVGKLPGDIMIKRENFSFYFPITTCLLLSFLLSLILFFISKK